MNSMWRENCLKCGLSTSPWRGSNHLFFRYWKVCDDQLITLSISISNMMCVHSQVSGDMRKSSKWKPLWIDVRAGIVMWPHGDSVREEGATWHQIVRLIVPLVISANSPERHTRVVHSHTATNALNTDRVVRGNTHSFCTCSGANNTTVGVCIWIEALPSNPRGKTHSSTIFTCSYN